MILTIVRLQRNDENHHQNQPPKKISPEVAGDPDLLGRGGMLIKSELPPPNAFCV